MVETKSTTLDDELLLSQVANGLLQVEAQHEAGAQRGFECPSVLLDGMHRLSARAVQHRQAFPQSCGDLFQWCRKSLEEWHIDLPAEYDLTQSLIEGDVTSELCRAMALSSADIELEFRQNHFFCQLINACRNDQAGYVAVRKFLIEHPVVTGMQLQLAAVTRELQHHADLLRSCYLPPPTSSVQEGKIGQCDRCRHHVEFDTTGKPFCASHRCRELHSTVRLSDEAFADDEAVVLRKEIRTFVSIPGAPELRLAENLNSIEGVEVELWPSLDAYDLRVEIGKDEVWAVDVKDWRSPKNLALSLRNKSIPDTPTSNRKFVVIPRDRVLQQSDYVRYCRNVLVGLEVADERQFVRLVKNTLRRNVD